MSRQYLHDLIDYARAKVRVRIVCKACGHRTTMQPWYLMTKLADVKKPLTFRDLRATLRCKQCRKRSADILRTWTD